MQWLKENGTVMPKVEFPAVFGEALQGVRLLEDLEKNEAILYVPNKCIISTEHARKSALAPLYEASDELFVLN